MYRLLVSALLLTALAGCGPRTVGQALGIERQAPDEFQVVDRAPLSLPPEYELRPPSPGAPRPQEGVPSDQARRILTGEANGATPRSAGSERFLAQAGTDAANPGIREVLVEETTTVTGLDEERFWFILDWQRNRAERAAGGVLEPGSEAQRLAEEGVPVVRTERVSQEPIGTGG